MRDINQAGIDLIKSFEGFYTKAYLCPAKVWTIGWGTTVYPDGSKVKKGDVCTREQAEKYLRNDLDSHEFAVTSAVKKKISDNAFAALVSFAYNVGNGAMRKSTLIKLLNAGDYEGAAGQFDRWNRGGGKVLAGLTRRRKAEKQLFLS